MAGEPEHLVSEELKKPAKFYLTSSQWQYFSRLYGEEWVKNNCMLLEENSHV